VPLENLEVRALETQADLKDNFCLEIFDEEAKASKRTMKSVKFRNGSIQQGLSSDLPPFFSVQFFNNINHHNTREADFIHFGV